MRISPRHRDRIPRRRFLCQSAAAAGALGFTSISEAAAVGPAPQQPYDITRFRDVDPKLIHYECLRRFAISKPDPRRIAIGPDDRLYVAAGHSLFILKDDGTPLHEITTGAAVRSIAVADDTTVYAGVKDHVEVFDARGRRTATWETPAGRPLLTGLAVSQNDLFAADAGNRIIWRFDRSGKLLGRIGGKDPRRNIPGFVIPSPFFDIAIGSNGLLYVANTGRHRVELYTFEGDLELAWGKAGAALEAFCGCCNPVAIEILSDHRVVTFEKGLPRVKIYSPAGELESVVAGPAAFTNPEQRTCEWSDCSYGGLDGAIDAQGRIFVLDLIEGKVQVMVRKGISARPTAIE